MKNQKLFFKHIPNKEFTGEVTVYYFYKKIGKNVYYFESFDKTEWTKRKTPYNQLPYMEVNYP